MAQLSQKKTSRQVTLFSVSTIVSSKDVRLPVQLQRALAAEAEAFREAKANVS